MITEAKSKRRITNRYIMDSPVTIEEIESAGKFLIK